MHIAAAMEINSRLVPNLKHLETALRSKVGNLFLLSFKKNVMTKLHLTLACSFLCYILDMISADFIIGAPTSHVSYVVKI